MNFATKLAVSVSSALALGNAAAQTVTTTQSGVAPASPMASMLQGMIGLAIVVALIFAAGWILRKIGPRARNSGAVQVLGGASVGPREKVVVVRFGHQTLLLGVASGHVSLLHVAEPGEFPESPADGAPVAPAAPSFTDRLRAARSQS